MQFKKKKCSLKKIKTINQQKQIESIETACPEKITFSPPKFLDPFAFYVIDSDLVIFDDVDKIPETCISILNILFDMKHVVSVDSLDTSLIINFEEKDSSAFTPIDFLLTRLRSLNDQNAYELSNMIENFQNFFKTLMKLQKEGGKAMINSLNDNLLAVIHKYYYDMKAKSIEEENFAIFLTNYLNARETRATFCLIYNINHCMQITGFLVNNTMKNLVSKKDFDYINCDFLFLDKEQYFQSYLKTLETYFTIKPTDTFEYLVKTKDGLRKMNFQIEKWYLNMNTGRKKVFVFFTEIPAKSPKFIQNLSQVINTMEEEKKGSSLNHQNQWKKLVDLYFGPFLKSEKK